MIDVIREQGTVIGEPRTENHKPIFAALFTVHCSSFTLATQGVVR